MLEDLEELRKAVFGDVGSEPNVYADRDRVMELEVKLNNILKVLRLDAQSQALLDELAFRRITIKQPICPVCGS